MTANDELQRYLDALEKEDGITSLIDTLLDVLERRLLFASAVYDADALRNLQEKLSGIAESIAPVVEQETESEAGSAALDALTFGDEHTRALLFKTGEQVEPYQDVSNLRAHPRFMTRQKVTLRASGREQAGLWTTDISKGGTFISTDQPPAKGESIEVVLNTDEGDIVLPAVVVRQVAGRSDKDGAAVQFTELDTATRTALEAFVDEIAIAEQGSDKNPVRYGDDTQQALADFLHSVEAGSYYAALGVSPNAEAEEIAGRVMILSEVFKAAAAGSNPQGKARIEVAQHVLERVSAVLQSPAARLAQDLDAGSKGPDANAVDPEHVLWQQAFPRKVETAQAKVKAALAAADERRFLDAAELAEAALRQDPFNTALKDRASRWRSLSVLVDEMKRGIVDSEALMPLIEKAGISLASARVLWREMFPDKLDQASSFGRDAVEKLEEGDAPAALTAARLALQLDPFNQRVRNVISACERLLSA